MQRRHRTLLGGFLTRHVHLQKRKSPIHAGQSVASSAPVSSLPGDVEGRRYTKCAIEWCESRAQAKVADVEASVIACKKHATWLATPVPGTKVGFRTGRFAARCKLEDHAYGHMGPASLSPDGTFEHRCLYCRALHFYCEQTRGQKDEPRWLFSKCCNHGRLRDIPCLPPAPPQLATLLAGRSVQTVRYPYHPFSKVGQITQARMSMAEFRSHKHFAPEIRRYNTALGFASYCDHIEKSSPLLTGSRGQPVYILKGRAYHMVGTLYPQADERPRYAQLYSLDPTDAADHRAATFETLKRPLLQRLHAMLVEPMRPVDMWTGEAAPMDPTDYPPRNPYPAYFLQMITSRLLSSKELASGFRRRQRRQRS